MPEDEEETGSDSNPADSFGKSSYNNNANNNKRGKSVKFKKSKKVSKVYTSQRRIIASTQGTTNNNPHCNIKSSYCEIDNHADTACLGENFIPLSFIGKVCDVKPAHR